MSENTFNIEEFNSTIDSPQYYIDNDGALRFISPMLASSNFDGSVPIFEGTISASALTAGMSFQIENEEYVSVVSISKDDPDLEDSPSTDIEITYIDQENNISTVVYDFSDQVDVRYEDWDNRFLGTDGWLLTYGGNAIFSNVAVRGDIEAQTLDVGGVDGITYDGNSVVIGASVVINAPVVFNGPTFEFLSASYTTLGLTTSSYANLSQLSTSGQTIINGGNISTGTINANNVAIQVGSGGEVLRIGASVGGLGNDGIFINQNNYWYKDGRFEVGNSESGFTWDGDRFYVTGARGITTKKTSASALGGEVIILQDGGNQDIRISPDRVQILDYSKNSFGDVTLRFSGSPYFMPGREYRVFGLPSPFSGVFLMSSPCFTGRVLQYTTSGGTVSRTNAPPGAGVSEEFFGSSSVSTISQGFGFIGAGRATRNPFGGPGGDLFQIISTVIASPRIYWDSPTTATTRSTIELFTDGRDALNALTGPRINLNARFIRLSGPNRSDGRVNIQANLDVNGQSSFNLPIDVNSARFRISDSGAGEFSLTVNNNDLTTGDSTRIFLPDIYNNLQSGAGRRNVTLASTGRMGYDSQPSTWTMKHNIFPIHGEKPKTVITEERFADSLDIDFDHRKILDLTPVVFDWDNGDPREVGIIAEEVEKIYPIGYKNIGTPSYNRDTMLGSLLAVVKDQQKTIEDLERRVIQLESQLGG